jgi:hypothetical protein
MLPNIGIHLRNYTVSIQKTTIQNFSPIWKPIWHAASHNTITYIYIYIYIFKKLYKQSTDKPLTFQRAAARLMKRYCIQHLNPNATSALSRPKIDSGCQRNVGGVCARLCRGSSCEPTAPHSQSQTTRYEVTQHKKFQKSRKTTWQQFSLIVSKEKTWL